MKSDEKKHAISRLLSRGVVEVVDFEKLKKDLEGTKKLRVKHGIDPTGKGIHIGSPLNEFHGILTGIPIYQGNSSQLHNSVNMVAAGNDGKEALHN